MTHSEKRKRHAADEYENHAAVIAGQMLAIKKALMSHRAVAAAQPGPSWADVGDLSYIRQQMAEILNTMNGHVGIGEGK